MDGSGSNREKFVLVLHGGGALGAYQGGVYEALAEAGLVPDWVAGISIGAINSAIIAGNPPEQRVPRLVRRGASQAGLHEGGHQQQQRAARQVEVGDQGIESAEDMTGPDEQPCLARERLQARRRGRYPTAPRSLPRLLESRASRAAAR